MGNKLSDKELEYYSTYKDEGMNPYDFFSRVINEGNDRNKGLALLILVYKLGLDESRNITYRFFNNLRYNEILIAYRNMKNKNQSVEEILHQIILDGHKRATGSLLMSLIFEDISYEDAKVIYTKYRLKNF
jgi:hypothetical protein